MEFYVYLNGVKRGPFPAERVASFLAVGLLQPSDLASERPDSELKSLATFLSLPAMSAENRAAKPRARRRSAVSRGRNRTAREGSSHHSARRGRA